MVMASAPRRNLLLFAVVLTFLFSITYFRHAAYDNFTTVPEEFQTPPPHTQTDTPPLGVKHATPSPHDAPQLPHVDTQTPPLPPPAASEEPVLPSLSGVCDLVDFDWLTSDRIYWDGWSSKSMFMDIDGSFTLGNVTVEAGREVCVVVLLGPIPAVSAIRPEIHFAPADSIILHAVAESVKFPITLEQHYRHTNVYYASVRFTHQGDYLLDTTTEYRSYFWEDPIYHPFRPFQYSSKNFLSVVPSQNESLPILVPCDATHLQQQVSRSWVTKPKYRELYPLDFYGMFGAAQEDHAVDDQLYMYDQCRLEYISGSQAAQCLHGKTIHVWGDNHIKRNLKAFSTANRWCPPGEPCECHDTDDDAFEWTENADVPLRINATWQADTTFHFNRIGSIVLADVRQEIKGRAGQYDAADMVWLSFGNDDIPISRLTPRQFAQSFRDLVTFLVTEVYPHQPIVIRTPQYFCCGFIHGTSWNAGRARAFATIVRQTVGDLQRERPGILLWDTHHLGMQDSTCIASGSTYSRRNVVNIENLLLWNLLCSA
ncbi:hypothetical protein BCR43DRAFT_516104 [Syncephalastrum racemosum]|uniref:Uncharacterized protein n=1 Tax=Syncephalastrum racemosum TaxID=13706 RepID=A0A1X2H780_SYNRA|nr:hypothetical protein BCR43DRAFT_516104 [Syncephalastrum racemosum]